ncbi:MAG: response regulator transcription factor [Sulfurospirillaceae bacterium]|nr:response regulator transcription factor [Sulfurospirillaceae bacterium]MCK9545131.1 response regulator transcription factor [Sulfurospirillaceae bacterium]MDY0237846.1 response regulator transcription factor [Campylobacterales bacterium]NLM99195.1 response regulator transcription factor [Campylobacteraceae bacterium]
MSARIFLLEDDMNLSSTIEDFLTQKGYEVTTAYDGESAEDLLYEKRFDLLLLDVNVPGIDGFELLKRARGDENLTPAIYITSLNSVKDVEDGFKSGCDDYIRKPFALKELLLRVENLLKREFAHINDNQIKISQNIYFDPNGLNLYINEKKQPLQPKEARLLSLLLKKRGEVVTHEHLLSSLWSYDESPSEGSLRTYIKNLRKHIGKDSIVSIKKLGYKLTNS